MKIKVKIINDYTSIVPVWLGKIKDNIIYKDGKADFEQTRMRAKIKKYLKDQESLELKLKKWSKEEMGA